MEIARSTLISMIYGNTNLYHNYAIVNQEISINGGTPIAGWLIMEHQCKNGLFQGTTISGIFHISIYIYIHIMGKLKKH
jgi:hypothetical protein